MARPAKSVALYVNVQIGRNQFLYCLRIRGSILDENSSSYLSVNREDNEPIFHLIMEIDYQYMDLNYPAYIWM